MEIDDRSTNLNQFEKLQDIFFFQGFKVEYRSQRGAM